MKKDKKWLEGEVDKIVGEYQSENIFANFTRYMIYDIKDVIDQLDEPEVLSEEWLDENKSSWTKLKIDGYYIPVEKIQNLLVPKQEVTYENAIKTIAKKHDTDEFSVGLYLEALINNKKYEFLTEKWIEDNTSPVDDEGRLYIWKSDLENLLVPKQELPTIPQFVADWIDDRKETGFPIYQAIRIVRENSRFEHSHLREWLRTNKGQETFARAWLDGYTVEEEQKYYVMNNDNRVMLVRMMDGKTITEADPFKLEDMYEGEKESHRLTEQEIKDYDPRYWAFAKPVEEVQDA